MWPPHRKQSIALGVSILESSTVPLLSPTGQPNHGEEKNTKLRLHGRELVCEGDGLWSTLHINKVMVVSVGT